MKKAVLGNFNSELQDLILQCIRTACSTSNTWIDIQGSLATQLRNRFGEVNINENVPLDKLGVPGVRAEIDIVCSDGLADRELGGFLLHISGHKLPRHEKEILEFITASLYATKFRHAVMVVCSDNALRLEGKTNSFSYCSGPLKRLIEPVLKHSNLQGLLLVGLPTPSPE